MNRDEPRFTSKSTDSRSGTGYARRMLITFYRNAREDYMTAGCPFGKTDDGMLLWFEYGQDTTVN